MELAKYLQDSGISSAKFARTIGVSVHAVKKWRRKKRNGDHERTPRPRFMIKIEKATDGLVQPKDWY